MIVLSNKENHHGKVYRYIYFRNNERGHTGRRIKNEIFRLYLVPVH